MAKVTYSQALKETIVKAALALRADGKTWAETLRGAAAAGFKGSVSSLQKMVRDSIHNDSPAPRRTTARKTEARKSAELAAVSVNAFDGPKTKTRTNNALPPTSATSAVESFEALAERFPILRDGVQFTRPISLFHGPFFDSRDGELRAWSHILGDEEALCVENTNAVHPRGADVVVDAERNPAGISLSVVFIGGESAQYALNSSVEVQRRWDGTAFVAIRDLPPGGKLVLSNSTQRVLALD